MNYYQGGFTMENNTHSLQLKTDTLSRILDIATEEFQKNGFQKASLREIVKKAGVTTGAFYGYYKSKEELFEALVGDTADTMLAFFEKEEKDFENLPEEEQLKRMGVPTDSYIEKVCQYAFENRKALKLILTAGSGTRYEDFIHQLTEREERSTHKFIEVLSKHGYNVQPLNPYVEHVLYSGMYASFFELIVHDVPTDEAMKCARSIVDFYTAGWMSIFGSR